MHSLKETKVLTVSGEKEIICYFLLTRLSSRAELKVRSFLSLPSEQSDPDRNLMIGIFNSYFFCY